MSGWVGGWVGEGAYLSNRRDSFVKTGRVEEAGGFIKEETNEWVGGWVGGRPIYLLGQGRLYQIAQQGRGDEPPRRGGNE